MTVTGYTASDMGVWAETMARVYAAGGATADDIVHNAYGYGLFTGGLGFHIGAQRIGATVIPVSGGLTKRQIEIMQDLGSTILACTPSYALVLAEEAAAKGFISIHLVNARGRSIVAPFGTPPYPDRAAGLNASGTEVSSGTTTSKAG